MPRQAGSCRLSQTLGSAGMQIRAFVYFQRALRGRNPNALTSPVATVAEGRASAPKLESASARAVRPLAASARSQWLGAGSGLCAEPSFGIEEKGCLSGHSFLGRTKKPMPIKALVSLGRVTACSEKMQALLRTAALKTRGLAVQAALPNPSIERTNNGVSSFTAYANAQSPLFASHLKR